MGEQRRRLARGGSSPPQGLRAAGTGDLLAECRDLLRRGLVRDAFNRGRQALALEPGLPEANHLLGRCAVALGETRSALAFLGAAAAAEPANAAYRASLGRACSGAGQLEDAARHLAAACTLGADADMRRDLGAVLFHLDRPREAEQEYVEAARMAPERADLHEALARLRYRRDAIDAALESYRTAVALDPGLAARLNLGQARCAGAGGSITSWLAATRESWRAVQAGAALAAAGTPDPEGALRQACVARSLLVIDDFLADPMAYRRRALALEYVDRTLRAGVNYPGMQTEAQPCDAIMQRIADALGRDIKWDSLDNGAFRLTPAGGRARCDIHVDTDAGENAYAALLYLSLPEHCHGGTGFWRHRATGWERRPSKEELAASGYSSFLEFERRWVPTDKLRSFEEMRDARDAAWDCVLHVPMRFNRLIIYRGDYFHAIADLFGDRPENTRLVQLFYFEGTGAAPAV
ncbi:MAG TPA: DUF6445 family protein [Burkholderiaceae bacterium]|nr:DUF6445 family protein [Burkholderiaceae bacterium]